jgi:hypothetical protein
MLINQSAISAGMHDYRMTTVNNDNSVISYGEFIANFWAAYTATQESVKTQGLTIALMQAQLQGMQQYCMALQQQPPPAIYALQQQHHSHRGSLRCTFQGGSGGYKAPAYLQLAVAGQHLMQPPMLFKRLRIGIIVTRLVATSTTTTPAECAKC